MRLFPSVWYFAHLRFSTLYAPNFTSRLGVIAFGRCRPSLVNQWDEELDILWLMKLKLQPFRS